MAYFKIVNTTIRPVKCLFVEKVTFWDHAIEAPKIFNPQTLLFLFERVPSLCAQRKEFTVAAY